MARLLSLRPKTQRPCHYATGEQAERVDADGVHLKVSEDDLAKK